MSIFSVATLAPRHFYAAAGLLVCAMAQGQATSPANSSAASPTPTAPNTAAAPVAGKPTLFVVGDSTASSPAPIQGWATPFPSYFDPAKIRVVNRAHGGASSRSFMNAYWPALLKELQPGDFVLVQFGHNDGGAPGTGTRPERPDLRGLGEETVAITDAAGQPETVHTFGWYLRKYIADAHAKGATVILLTPTPTNNWTNGKIGRGLGNYGPWTKAVAQAQNVPLVDMNSIAADKYDAMGPEKLTDLYSTDKTHSTPAGADFNAQVIVSGLKALKNPSLTSFLSPKGQAVETADTKYVAENLPAAGGPKSGTGPVPVATSVTLFNGKNLDGWSYIAAGQPANISAVCQVKDGVLTVTGVPGRGTGYLVLPDVRADYQLHVEWRWPSSNITASTNSGILVNITDGPLQQGLWPVSFQIQTKVSRAGDIISMSTAACAEAAAGQTANRRHDASEKPAGEWNAADITVRGDTIACTINGVAQNAVTKCAPGSGKIGFQLEGYPYELRNLTLTPLPPEKPVAAKTN